VPLEVLRAFEKFGKDAPEEDKNDNG